MHKFRVSFNGRKIGAIGLFGFHIVEVEAETPEDAALKAYDTHEHISGTRA